MLILDTRKFAIAGQSVLLAPKKARTCAGHFISSSFGLGVRQLGHSSITQKVPPGRQCVRRALSFLARQLRHSPRDYSRMKEPHRGRRLDGLGDGDDCIRLPLGVCRVLCQRHEPDVDVAKACRIAVRGEESRFQTYRRYRETRHRILLHDHHKKSRPRL